MLYFEIPFGLSMLGARGGGLSNIGGDCWEPPAPHYPLYTSALSLRPLRIGRLEFAASSKTSPKLPDCRNSGLPFGKRPERRAWGQGQGAEGERARGATVGNDGYGCSLRS